MKPKRNGITGHSSPMGVGCAHSCGIGPQLVHNAYGSVCGKLLAFCQLFFATLSCNFESCSVVFAFRCFVFCLFFIKDDGYFVFFPYVEATHFDTNFQFEYLSHKTCTQPSNNMASGVIRYSQPRFS